MTVDAAVANGVAYASTYGHNYFAYDVSTGNQLWNAGFDTFTGVTDGPAVVNGNLYFLSIDGYMYDYADLTPPAFIFDSAPAPETQSSSASFTWHPSETITGSYSCKLDGVAKTCSVPMMPMIRLKKMTGERTGSVTCQALRKFEAPSMSAAS